MSDSSRVLTLSVPADTPAGATIFLAADFNGWSPSRPLSRAIPQADGTQRFVLPPDLERAEFKITRGSWDTVECTTHGEPLGNRVWTADSHNGDLKVEIGGWCDLHPGTLHWRPRHTIIGDLRIMKDIFSPQLGNMRDILVWLPPEYDVRPNERYPVMYIHDGQNLLSDVSAFVHESGGDDIST